MPPKTKRAPTYLSRHYAYCRRQDLLFQELNGAALTPAQRSQAHAASSSWQRAKKTNRAPDYGNVYTFCPSKASATKRPAPSSSIIASTAEEDERLLARLEAARKKRELDAFKVHNVQASGSQATPSTK
ncbi:hypothetical protein B0H15DRAFT_956513 [Mycena belliarum]|uniref:Uncharacterized protein n=1 Tax=Mycena belliarum TaxID=1033014 RepID=A0AAD6XF79_9AGAR|nr:hypothetical protein B0H15DRAFT_956513 [Mycena belliae]